MGFEEKAMERVESIKKAKRIMNLIDNYPGNLLLKTVDDLIKEIAIIIEE